MSLYDLMCKTSPIQKDWKPKIGDNTTDGVIVLFDLSFTVVNGEQIQNPDVVLRKIEEGDDTIHRKFVKDLIWEPRQEDWQEIYLKHKPEDKEIEKFTDVIYGHYECTDLLFDDIIGNFNLMWCLFVHKEVYNLVWDWEEKKWVKL